MKIENETIKIEPGIKDHSSMSDDSERFQNETCLVGQRNDVVHKRSLIPRKKKEVYSIETYFKEYYY